MFLKQVCAHSQQDGQMPGLVNLFSEKCVCVCIYVCIFVYFSASSLCSYDVIVYYPLQVYMKQNNRLVLKVDKATGLAAANNDNTSDP